MNDKRSFKNLFRRIFNINALKEIPVLHKAFSAMLAVTILISGIIIGLVTPPFQTPDEPAHFTKAWMMS